MFEDKEQKLLEALSWHIWKSGLELVAEGAGERGTLYVHLYRLESGGFITSRLRMLSEEQLAARHGMPCREYKLTERGIQRRDEQAEVISLHQPVNNTA